MSRTLTRVLAAVLLLAATGCGQRPAQTNGSSSLTIGRQQSAM